VVVELWLYYAIRVLSKIVLDSCEEREDNIVPEGDAGHLYIYSILKGVEWNASTNFRL
jgi:hypothetical protein